MKRNSVLLVVGGALALVLLWWFLWYSPAQETVDDTQNEVSALQSTQQSLDAQLAALKVDEKRLPELAQTQDLLAKLIPNQPGLETFISKANTAAQEAGVDWVSITPTPPVASGSGPSTIALAIQVQGRFAAIIDYMNRLSDYNAFERLVIIDGVNLASGGTDPNGATGGPPTLTVGLTARIFTYATPDGSSGSGASGSGAGGSSPASTTTVAGSSTTAAGQVGQTKETVTSANNQTNSQNSQ